MYQESQIVSGEERYIAITNNGQFLMGARVTNVVEYNNLTLRKFKGWLNGHVIFDTGDLPKLENKLEYEINNIDFFDIKIKKGDIVFFRFSKGFFDGIIVGLSPHNTYFVDCGTYAYEIQFKNIVSINGISLETKQVIRPMDVKNNHIAAKVISK